MDWLTGGHAGEAKRLIAQLSDATQRDRAAQELIRLDTEAVTPLLETLQTTDTNLLTLVQRILAFALDFIALRRSVIWLYLMATILLILFGVAPTVKRRADYFRTPRSQGKK